VQIVGGLERRRREHLAIPAKVRGVVQRAAGDRVGEDERVLPGFAHRLVEPLELAGEPVGHRMLRLPRRDFGISNSPSTQFCRTRTRPASQSTSRHRNGVSSPWRRPAMIAVRYSARSIAP
jgi:hypothetical protein